MATLIRIKIDEDMTTEVACTQNGKRYVMTDPVNISNVAGILAKVSCEMAMCANKSKNDVNE